MDTSPVPEVSQDSVPVNNISNDSKDSPTSPSTPVPDRSSPPPAIDPIAKAEEMKEKGNVAFREKRFVEAVNYYTQAIGASSICCP